MANSLDPILTSTTNGYGPVANDTGADTLAHYRDWRKRRAKRETFLARLLRGWELRNEGWDELDEGRIQKQLADDSTAAFRASRITMRRMAKPTALAAS